MIVRACCLGGSVYVWHDVLYSGQRGVARRGNTLALWERAVGWEEHGERARTMISWDDAQGQDASPVVCER